MESINVVSALNTLITHYGTTYNHTSTSSNSVSDGDTSIVLDSSVFQVDGSLTSHSITIIIHDTVTTTSTDPETGESTSSVSEVPQTVFNGTVTHIDGNNFNLSSSISITLNGDEDSKDNRDANLTIFLNGTILSKCNDGIAKMGQVNPGLLTGFDFPTYNDIFLTYSEFTEVIIGQMGAYVNPDFINNKFIEWHLKMGIDSSPSNLNTSQIVINYIDGLDTMLVESVQIQVDVMAYYKRLKSAIVKWKLVEFKIKSQPSDGLLASLTSVGLAEVNELYNYWVVNGNTLYNEFKNQKLEELKIQG